LDGTRIAAVRVDDPRRGTRVPLAELDLAKPWVAGDETEARTALLARSTVVPECLSSLVQTRDDA
jgi:hypothetical protein